jgi:hypothetical protein
MIRPINAPDKSRQTPSPPMKGGTIQHDSISRA